MHSLVLRLLLLTLVLVSYQNCSQVFFSPVGSEDSKRILSSELNSGGNGGGYEGKPLGEYVRVVPGWSCEQQSVDEFTVLSTTKEPSMRFIANTKDTCHLQKPDVLLSDIQVFPGGNEVIGYKEGIYQKRLMDDANTSLLGPVEAWCTSWNDQERIDILMHQDGEKYKAKLVLGKNENGKWKIRHSEASEVIAIQLNALRKYRHPAMALDIDLAQNSSETVIQFKGTLKVQVDEQSIDRNVSCRAAKKYDPVINLSYCEQRTDSAPYANSNEPGIDGTSRETAYSICTAQQLNAIGANPDDWNKNFILKQNIDMSALNETYNIIGRPGQHFSGMIDGMDFQIQNLFFNNVSTDFVGLIGSGAQVTLENLALTDVKITGRRNVAGIIGFVDRGSISSVRVSGSISGNTSVGGIAADAPNGVILRNSLVDALIISGTDVGGLVAHLGSTGHVESSSSHGQILASGRAGGLIGSTFSRTTITKSYSNADVFYSGTGIGEFMGGLVGQSSSDITESYATGSVSGSSGLGGLIGQNSGSLKDVYATGAVEGQMDIGGLVGLHDGIQSIRNCYATGSVVGSERVGGLVGDVVQASVRIENCFARGHVEGTSAVNSVGPLTGYYVGPLSNTYIDPASTCTNTGSGSCNPTGLVPDSAVYPELFYDPSVSGPLEAWDFVNVWMTVPGMHPLLRQ